MIRKVLGRLLRPSPPPLLEAGTEAPAFTATAHDGTTVRLADQRGHKVLLWFYPRADTPGCTVEGKSLRDDFESFTAADVRIFGVSVDEVAANCAFADKFAFPYPLLCDTDRSISLAYRACASASDGHARRISYLIDEQGRIAHALDNVDPATHAATVLGLLT